MFIQFIRDTLEEIRLLNARQRAGEERTRAWLRARTCANCGARMTHPPECPRCGGVLSTGDGGERAHFEAFGGK